LYWQQAEYLGVGSSASSLRILEGTVGQRFANHRSVDKYFAAAASVSVAEPEQDPRVDSMETLSRDAFEREALWLSLRLIEGLPRSRHRARFGRDPLAAAGDRFARLRAAGLVEIDDEVVRLTPRGVLLADRVGEELL
jgi:oxygen-independent coproporphyrinogen-3 oxidase